MKRRGVKAFSAKDLGKLGLTDDEQLDIAKGEHAVILTHDADFLRIALKRSHSGIIFVHRQKYTVGEYIRRLKILAETKTALEIDDKVIFL